MKRRSINVLAVGGTDPLNGAGLTADLRTLASHGCHGLGVVSAVIAQNSKGVKHIAAVSDENFRMQLDSVGEDVPVDAVKVGMVASLSHMRILTEWLRGRDGISVIYDPVMSATAGGLDEGRLMEEAILSYIIEDFLDVVTLVTPNLYEYGKLLSVALSLGVDLQSKTAVLVKGGHAGDECSGAGEDKCSKAVDLLLKDGKEFRFEDEILPAIHAHGTGCALSSSIAAGCARGLELVEAVGEGKAFVHNAISTGYDIGNGKGPVNVDNRDIRCQAWGSLSPARDVRAGEGLLVHCITSSMMGYKTAQYVSEMGASPIMSEDWTEFEDFYEDVSSLLVNMGMPDEGKYRAIRRAAALAAEHDIPVVLDPVGCHSSRKRLAFARELMESGKIDILKCNSAEAKALLGRETIAKGIDNEVVAMDMQQDLACGLASRFGIKVIVTGRHDALAEPGMNNLSPVPGTSSPAQGTSSPAPYIRAWHPPVGTGCLLGAAVAVGAAKAKTSGDSFLQWSIKLMQDFRSGQANDMEGR